MADESLLMQNPIEQSLPRRKHAGIELLRIVSIFFVVTLHVLGQGGVFSAAGAVAFSSTNVSAVSMEIAAFGAVNLFALVSGFVALRSKWATKKWLKMWAMVAFWGVLMVFIIDKVPTLFHGFNQFVSCLIPNVRPDYEMYTVTATDYISALLPISAKQYWYFNMYTLLFLLMPLLNKAIAAVSHKKLALICAAALTGICLYGAIAAFRSYGDYDLFGTGGGYSSMWLVVMYLTGACVRRYYEAGFKPKKWACLVGYLVCVALAVGWYFFMGTFIVDDPQNTVLYTRRGIVTSYTSPLVVVGSLCLLWLFMQIDVSSKRLRQFIFTISGSAFAVYIIHAQQVVWRYYLTNRFAGIVIEPTWKMTIEVLLAVLVIYLTCTLLEIFRKSLFELTYLNKGLDLLGDTIDRRLKRVVYGKPKEEITEETTIEKE